MTKNKLRLTALILIAAGICFTVISLHKEVTLVIDGQSETSTTFAPTVGSFLQGQNVEITAEDQIHPAPAHFLREGEVVRLTTALPIQVLADGKQKSLNTPKRKPANILNEAGIPLYPHDRILVDGLPSEPDQPLQGGNPHLLEVRRGTPLTLIMDDGVINFTTSAETIAEALWEQDIPVYQADRIEPSLTTPLTGAPLEVSFERSQPFDIQLGEVSFQGRSTSSLVGMALQDAGFTLQGRDYSLPGEDKPLPENRRIEIIRVSEQIILNQEPLEFSSQFQPSSDLPLDEVKVLQGGAYGLKAQRVRVIYENGEEISRRIEKEWVVKEPEPRIVGYGTDINVRTVDTPDGPIRVWREITAFATSYNESCPGCDSITSSGAVLKKGIIAVTLEWYRYMQGLKVYIPGYGFGSIEDVGGGIPGKFWVDLGYKKKNYVPWSQNVTVYFLAPPPPPENIMYVLY